MKTASIQLLLYVLLPTYLTAGTKAPEQSYITGNAIWFDTPTPSPAGEAIWETDDFSATTTNPDTIWERQSLPIGNGSFGGTILGSINRDRIVLNEKTLWKGGPGTGAAQYWNMNRTVDSSTLSTIRQYLSMGDSHAADSIASNNFRGNIDYTKDIFGTYTMLGEAYVDTDIDERNITDYKRILNLDQSLAVVQFSSANAVYTRRYFCSYPDDVMVWRYTSTAKGQNLTFRFNCPQKIEKVIATDGGLTYIGTIDNNGMQWAMQVYVRTTDGGRIVPNASTQTITIDESNDIEFIIAADTDYAMNFNPDYNNEKTYTGEDPLVNVNNRINAAKVKTYEQLYDTHIADYSALFNRVKISINSDTIQNNQPTPVRLAKYRAGVTDNNLEQIYFQYGRYLLISSSRAGTMPANLQGLWHNNIDGPWRVDYHNNINLQMNYWHANSTNLTECFIPLIDYVRSLIKPGERTAKSYYNARGWTAEVSTNIFGFTAPLNSADMSWNYNPTAGPWLATQIWEYYDYTRDKEWLKNIGYDIISSSADFASDLLYYINGTYTSAPSYSPEHGPCDLGATYANAVTREILSDAIKAAQILNVDSERVIEWETKLNNIYPYQIGNGGQLQEWYHDIDDNTDQHRHTNHLFGLHPGSSISPTDTPELAEACKKTLNYRGDAATGWSMGWKLNHWARLHDGDHAYTLLRNLIKNGTADNLWDMHPPFQIDGNFGGTAGIAELFLQSHLGKIHILPALPNDWHEGYITGLLARGNFEVNIFYSDNKLHHAIIKSNKGEQCNAMYNGKEVVFATKAGEIYRIDYNKSTDSLSVSKL